MNECWNQLSTRVKTPLHGGYTPARSSFLFAPVVMRHRVECTSTTTADVYFQGECGDLINVTAASESPHLPPRTHIANCPTVGGIKDEYSTVDGAKCSKSFTFASRHKPNLHDGESGKA